MEMKLELVPIPVSDIDAARTFYVDKLGFVEDLDVRPGPNVRVVQLTPPGSACSIVLGTGMPQIDMDPGTIKGVHLVVGNVEEARSTLAAQGVEVSDVEDTGRGVKYAWFADPDGNTWALQEMPWRSPEFD